MVTEHSTEARPMPSTALYTLPTKEEVRAKFFRAPDHWPLIWADDLARLMGCSLEAVRSASVRLAPVFLDTIVEWRGSEYYSPVSHRIRINYYQYRQVEALQMVSESIKEHYKGDAAAIFLSPAAVYIMLMHYKFGIKAGGAIVDVILEAILEDPEDAETVYGRPKDSAGRLIPLSTLCPEIHPYFRSMEKLPFVWRQSQTYLREKEEASKPAEVGEAEEVKVTKEEARVERDDWDHLNVDAHINNLQDYLMQMRGLAATAHVEWSPSMVRRCIRKWSKHVPREVSDLLTPVFDDLDRKPITGVPKPATQEESQASSAEPAPKGRALLPGEFSEKIGIYSYSSYKRSPKNPRGHFKYINALLAVHDLVGRPEYGKWIDRQDKPRWQIYLEPTLAYLQKEYGEELYKWPNTVDGVNYRLVFFRPGGKVWRPIAVSRFSDITEPVALDHTIALRRYHDLTYSNVDEWNENMFLVWEGDLEGPKREESVMAVYQHLMDNDSADVAGAFAEVWGIEKGKPAFARVK